ncbi:MAG: hypothetical protein WCT25_03170 [Candidatus Paceibacterota bacterium]
MTRLKKYLPYILIAVILCGLAFSPLLINTDHALAATAGGSSDTPGGEGGLISTVASGVFDKFMSSVTYIILWLVARITWVSGALLDLSVYYSLNLATLLSRTNIVTIGWTIFRDLANVFFIFILLYYGIRMIISLPVDKNLITRLIVVALLINFSLFISRVVIDASNVVALQFYKAIRPNYTTDISNPDFYLDNISSQFMYGLQLSSTYDPGSGDKSVLRDTAGIASKKIIVMIMGIILLLVAAFVFAAAAILFTVRTVVLILLMILSPIAFIGSLIPKTQSYSEEWWTQLFNQSFFAPAYLVMTYVVLKALGGIQTMIPVPAGASFTDAFGGMALTSVSIIMNYVILIILMLSSLIIAKRMGAHGADMAQKAAGKMSFGMAGAFGRTTFGKVAQSFGGSKFAQGMAAKSGAVGAASRLALKATNAVGQSSFDLRATTMAGGGISSLVGDVGKPRTAKELAKEAEEDRKVKAQAQVKADNARLGQSISNLATTNPAAIPGIVSNLDKDQFKSIDPKIFVNNSTAAQSLEPEQLKNLQNNPDITQADRRAIRQHILNLGAVGTPTHTFMDSGPGSVLWA